MSWFPVFRAGPAGGTMVRMAHFLVELFAPRGSLPAVEQLLAALAAEKSRARHVQTILVPEDETCFVLLAAASAVIVEQTVEAAGIRPERIVEARVDGDDDVVGLVRQGSERRPR